MFHVFVVSFCMSINRVTYSSSDTFFLPLITYRYQLKDLILLLSFLKLLAMPNLRLKEVLEDQINIFQGTYFESS